jgi:hypothetical protein
MGADTTGQILRLRHAWRKTVFRQGAKSQNHEQPGARKYFRLSAFFQLQKSGAGLL